MKLLIALICFVFCGCINGPVRYKTIGFRKYVTQQIYSESSAYTKPALMPAGVVIDSTIVLADSVAIPGFCIYRVLGYPFDEPDLQETLWYAATFPVMGPFVIITGIFGLPYASEQDYQDLFGEEKSWTGH